MSLIFGRNKSDSQDSTSNKEQTIGSNALQKAIERNRLKLLQKDPQAVSSGPSKELPTPTNSLNRPPIPLEEKLKQLRVDSSPNVVLPSSKPVTISPPPLTSSPSFLPNKVPNPDSISTQSFGLGSINTTKSKWENIRSNIFNYFLKGMWVFSIILLLRLVFADRGVLEYYFRRKKVNEKLETLDNQVKINKKLTKEISRIQKDITFQKSLVRNHLGFIADDEFIVVLPEAKNKI